MLADCPSKESVRQLGQLMCLNGFITDPTHAGVDRITVTCPRPDIGMVSPFSISADQISEDYEGHDILAAHGLIYCKGWLRSVTANLLMLFAYDSLTSCRPLSVLNQTCMHTESELVL